MTLLLQRTPSLHPCPHITESEVSDVLATCKAGKSCGDDGISYELLNVIMHSGLRVHLVDLFNAVLFQVHEIPPSWLLSHLTFLPKIAVPSLPKHLRPIVLSSTPCKLFTKILLMRLRPCFPPITANQLACMPGSQTLDGSACLQHIIHLSQEYRLPLIAIKLDVSSAFDHLSHDAVASYLSLCGGRLEALILLKIITLSRVSLNMSGVSWQQKLFRGLLQGSSYSAEIFGRTLDHFLGFLNTRWSISENTWIQSTDPHGLVTTISCTLMILSSWPPLSNKLNDFWKGLLTSSLPLASPLLWISASSLFLPTFPVARSVFEASQFLRFGLFVFSASSWALTLTLKPS